jgi:plastocyanin
VAVRHVRQGAAANRLDRGSPPAFDARVRSILLLALIVGCDDGSPAIDASASPDTAVDAAIDGKVIDAMPDASVRAASLVDCTTVTGIGGLTAEVTDTTGYVPTATATFQIGQIARFAYADGGTTHTIVSGTSGAPDGVFASPPFSDHGTFTCIQFDAPGVYPLHCGQHPNGMEQGTITVVP